jgi:hypothetical protein
MLGALSKQRWLGQAKWPNTWERTFPGQPCALQQLECFLPGLLYHAVCLALTSGSVSDTKEPWLEGPPLVSANRGRRETFLWPALAFQRLAGTVRLQQAVLEFGYFISGFFLSGLEGNESVSRSFRLRAY